MCYENGKLLHDFYVTIVITSVISETLSSLSTPYVCLEAKTCTADLLHLDYDAESLCFVYACCSLLVSRTEDDHTLVLVQMDL